MKITRRKRNVLRGFLVLIMVLFFVTIPVTAEENGSDEIAYQDANNNGGQDSGEEVFTTINEALAKGGTIRLLKSFVTEEIFTMTSGSAVLDLAGQHITFYSDHAVDYNHLSFKLSGTADLTVTDRNGDIIYPGGIWFAEGGRTSISLKDSATLTFAGGYMSTLASGAEYPYALQFPDGNAGFKVTGGLYDINNIDEYVADGYVAAQDGYDRWRVWPDGAENCTVNLNPTEYIIMANSYGDFKPDVTVTDKNSNTILSRGVDYRVAYNDNYGPGKAKAVITFCGNYRGTVTKEFKIKALAISANCGNNVQRPGSGSEVQVVLTAKLDIEDVTKQTNWSLEGNYPGITLSGNTVTVSSAAEPGQIRVKGTYTGGTDSYAFYAFSVVTNPIPDFTVSPGNFSWNGTEQKPEISFGTSYNLKENVDYTVSYYRNNQVTTDLISAGIIMVHVNGIGKYNGMESRMYSISKLVPSEVTSSYVKEYTYDGKPHILEVTHTVNSSKYVLKEGTDYFISNYTRNGEPTEDFISAGSISYEIRGSENCSLGLINGSYKIKPADISGRVNIETSSVTYDAEAHIPEVTVAGVPESDYTVSYKRDGVETTDFTSAGYIRVTVNGKGNYTGTVSEEFTIDHRQISAGDVSITPASAVWNGTANKPRVTVSGVPESDYTVSYKRDGVETTDFTSCGTVTVTVKGTGNCYDTVEKSYVIEHDPDFACGHRSDFALIYQAPGSDEKEYTDNLNYLQKDGTITLQKSISLTKSVVTGNLTIVMNGNSITLPQYKYFSNNSGNLTIDATAGGSIGAEGDSAQELIAQGNQLKIIGNLVLEENMFIGTYDNTAIDLTEYTGEGLLIRVSINDVIQKPSLPAGYMLISWTRANGDGDRLEDDTLRGYNTYGKVIGEHKHSWTYTADGAAVTAVCGKSNCSVTDGRASVALKAPADLVYDGNEKIVSVVGEIPDTAIPKVVYHGDRKNVTAGGFTASITLGNATAKLNVMIEKDIIDTIDLDVAGPEAGNVPQVAVSGGASYSAAIAWNPAAEKFGYNTAYTAVVMLTPDGNHAFGNNIHVEGWASRYAGDVLTLTRTFAATRMERLTDAAVPGDQTLSIYCADADAAMKNLPSSVTFITETGTRTAAIQWSCSNYNPACKAENRFTWEVKPGELTGYNVNGQVTSGSVKVINAAAVPVVITAKDMEMVYNGATCDVASMFTIDSNAGAASYTFTGGTGEGTLAGSVLTVTRPGTFIIRLNTAAREGFASGEAAATLTVTVSGCTHIGKNTSVVNALAATCAAEGYTGDTLCECGAVIVQGTVIAMLPAHTWGDWTVTTEPSYNTEGSQTRTCSVCTAAETETIPAVIVTPGTPEDIVVETEDVKVSNTTYTLITTASGTVTAEYKAPAKKKAASATIPDTIIVEGKKVKVTAVAANAFKKNTKLKKVVIGKHVQTIGENAFYGCTKLSGVTFKSKNTLTEVKAKAFYGCKALTKITLPDCVTAIRSSAFANCTKLKTVNIGKKVTAIGNSAFSNCTALTKITLPNKVEKIGKKAFYKCKKLKSITINTSKLTGKTVGKEAFKGIYSKAAVNVPNKKLKSYKRILKASGMPKAVKMK